MKVMNYHLFMTVKTLLSTGTFVSVPRRGPLSSVPGAYSVSGKATLSGVTVVVVSSGDDGSKLSGGAAGAPARGRRLSLPKQAHVRRFQIKSSKPMTAQVIRHRKLHGNLICWWSSSPTSTEVRAVRGSIRHTHSVLSKREAVEPADFRTLAEQSVQALVASSGRHAAVDFLSSLLAGLSSQGATSSRGVAALEEARSAATAAAPDRAIDPLAAARARGRRFAVEQYAHPDNLTLLDARTYAGRNERTINEQRQRGELYALVPPGKVRGFRYPKWQFDVEPRRLAAVLELFVDDANCWVIHAFMLRKRDALGGQSPAQVIGDARAELAPVLELAQRELVDEQGAS